MTQSALPPIDRRRFIATLLTGSAAWSWTSTAVRSEDAAPATTAWPVDQRVGTIRDELAPLIRDAQRRLRVPALSLALVDPDRLLWSEGFGLADVETGAEATPTTSYRAGSLAKPLTATAVMQLAGIGAIDIERPLATYLPAFRIRSRFQPAVPQITIRGLLSHHSGLPTDLNKGMWTDEPLNQILAVLQEEYVAFPPDLVFCYSNLGYSLLGLLLERVSGLPFDRYMRERVLGPLGMTQTHFASWPSPGIARGYRAGAAIELLPVRDLPAHGVETSCTELARLMRALLGGGRLDGHQILTPEAVEAMFAVQNRDNRLDMGVFTGLGWFLEQDTIRSCGRLVRQGGTMLGFSAECILLPEEGLGIAVLANSAAARRLLTRLAEETLSRVLAVAPQPLSAELFLAPAERRRAESAVVALEGDYATDLGLIAFRPDEGQLCACMLGKTFGLTPYPGGWYGIAPESLETLPPGLRPLAEARFQTQRLDGREVVIARRGDREMVLGEKAPPPALSQGWRERVGRYEVLNADPGFPVLDAEIKLREERLCFSYRMPRLTAATIQVPLQPVSENEAIILGLGRTRGETVRMVRHADEERLRFSGLIARKLEGPP